MLVLWTLLFPESFYADVPTVDLTPPFSEHLFRDFGGTTVGLAVVLTAAAIWLERRLAGVALLAYLSFPPRTWCSTSGTCAGRADRRPRCWSSPW